MTGHRSFKELTKGFSTERKARVAARVAQLKADMPLHERELNVGQPGELDSASDQPDGSS